FLTVDGPARLIGPECPVLADGATGCWLRLSGDCGSVRLTARLREHSAQTQIEIVASVQQ
ncbi:hypothetical protein, partial [Thioclava indica]|uniref:hypothetical protein n=1 Tax=Thioclava indica TaxID=1353528 RepID=UPI00196A108E